MKSKDEKPPKFGTSPKLDAVIAKIKKSISKPSKKVKNLKKSALEPHSDQS